MLLSVQAHRTEFWGVGRNVHGFCGQLLCDSLSRSPDARVKLFLLCKAPTVISRVPVHSSEHEKHCMNPSSSAIHPPISRAESGPTVVADESKDPQTYLQAILWEVSQHPYGVGKNQMQVFCAWRKRLVCRGSLPCPQDWEGRCPGFIF